LTRTPSSQRCAGQTRTGSLAEAVANVLAGFGMAIVVQRLVYPLFGIVTTLTQDGAIALIFTAASIARSYGIRRLFVMLEHQRERERRECARQLEQRLATGRL